MSTDTPKAESGKPGHDVTCYADPNAALRHSLPSPHGLRREMQDHCATAIGAVTELQRRASAAQNLYLDVARASLSAVSSWIALGCPDSPEDTLCHSDCGPPTREQEQATKAALLESIDRTEKIAKKYWRRDPGVPEVFGETCDTQRTMADEFPGIKELE